MNAFGLWVQALRPRTLVLALAGVSLGQFLAATGGHFAWLTCLLTLLTAVLLQVLSNLANDYGDSLHGVDDARRVGPQRAVQSGRVSLRQMFGAVVLSALLAGVAGLALILLALGGQGLLLALAFLLLGALAIWAAYAYTATARPYGYVGLGDVMVFTFFGPVAVVGSHYLQVGRLDALVLLPAAACGLLAVAVLNINNMRDLAGDRLAGKLTVPVRLGLPGARVYHTLLLGGAAILALLFVLLDWHSPWQLLFLLSLPLLAGHLAAVRRGSGAELDPLLKQMALATLLFCLLLGVGQLF